MSFVLDFAVSMAVGSIMEIDEVYHEVLPDGRLKVVFVTTGVTPTTAKIKTMLWALFGLPVQKVDEIDIEEEQSGALAKRYRVTVVLKPVLDAIRHGEGLGIIDVLTGRNVNVKKQG